MPIYQIQYSKDYQAYLARQSFIKNLIKEAKEKATGSKLYGEEVNINNLEELLAMYYILSTEIPLYHEPRF